LTINNPRISIIDVPAAVSPAGIDWENAREAGAPDCSVPGACLVSIPHRGQRRILVTPGAT
jgi:hypothetical protein